MSINVATLPDYSDADVLKVYRWALVNNAAGETRTINGRSITFPAADKIMEIIGLIEMRIQAAGGGTSAMGRTPEFVPQAGIPGIPR